LLLFSLYSKTSNQHAVIYTLHTHLFIWHCTTYNLKVDNNKFLSQDSSLMKTLAIVIKVVFLCFLFLLLIFKIITVWSRKIFPKFGRFFFLFFFKDANTDRRANCSPSEYSSQTSDGLKLIFRNKHYTIQRSVGSHNKDPVLGGWTLEVTHSNRGFFKMSSKFWQDVKLTFNHMCTGIPPSRLTGHWPSKDIHHFAFLWIKWKISFQALFTACMTEFFFFLFFFFFSGARPACTWMS